MKASPHRVAVIREYIASGKGLTAAAKALGMKKQHAWRIARNLGLTRRIGRPRKWSDEQLVAALQEFHRQMGRAPAREETGGQSIVPNASVYVARFGSWTEALAVAKVPGNATGIRLGVEHARRVLGEVPAPRVTRITTDIRDFWLSRDTSLRSA